MTVNLLPAVRELGYEPLLVLGERKGPLLEMVPPDVEIVVLGASSTIGAVLPLTKFLRARRPAVLVSSFGHPNIVALWARILSGADVKTVIVQHAILTLEILDTPTLQYRALPFLYRSFAGAADAIVAVSKGVAKDMAERTGLPPEKFTVIYNAAVNDALERLGNEPADHPFFRDGAPPVFLSSGRLVGSKDFSTLIDAFAIFRKRHEGRLAILGVGPLEEALKAQCATLGLSDDVAFLGFHVNPYPFMKRASALVVSSLHESFGLVLVEAMALGTPVVSTDCPTGPAEILMGGQYGELVPMKDAPALAKAMENVLSESITPEVLKARAATFSVDAIAREYVDLFDRLCDASGGALSPRRQYQSTSNG